MKTNERTEQNRTESRQDKTIIYEPRTTEQNQVTVYEFGTTGQDRTEQNRAEQNRTERNRTEQSGTEQNEQEKTK